MADFCWQCTVAVLGLPGKDNDLAGLVPETQPFFDWLVLAEQGKGDKRRLCAEVLCEGCGYICVDNEGKCLREQGNVFGHQVGRQHE